MKYKSQKLHDQAQALYDRIDDLRWKEEEKKRPNWKKVDRLEHLRMKAAKRCLRRYVETNS